MPPPNPAGKGTSARCCALLPLLLVGLAGRGAGQGRVGVVVVAVESHRGAAHAGIEPGDELVRWYRPANPPGSPREARGTFESPLDLAAVELGQGPRAAVQLTGTRNGRVLTWTVGRERWGISARPQLSDRELDRYTRGKTLVQAGNGVAGSELWTALATDAAARGNEELATWLELEVATATPVPPAGLPLPPLYERAARGATLAGSLHVLPQVWYAAGESEARRLQPVAADEAYLRAARVTYAQECESPAVAAYLNRVGRQQELRPDPLTCIPVKRRALAICQRVARGSALHGATLTNLGVMENKAEESATAEALHRAAVRVYEEVAPDSADLLAAVSNLGSVLLVRKDLDAAEPCYRRALQLAEERFSGTAFHAAVLRNLGLVLRERGDLADAERLFQRALGVMESLSPGGSGVVGCLLNLGVVAEDRGDLERAEELGARALALQEKRAPESDDVAVALHNLGVVAWRRLDLLTAESFLTRALRIREVRAPGSMAVAETLTILAGVNADLGRLKTAEAQYLRALEVRERLAPGSLPVAGSLNSLGWLSTLVGDQVRAEERFAKAAVIAESAAPESLTAALGLSNLGEARLERGDLAAAEEPILRALAIRQRLTPGSVLEAVSLHALGVLRKRQGRLDEALRHLEAAVDAIEAQRATLGGGREAGEKLSEEYAQVYRDLIALQVELGQTPQAFLLLERYRAQVLPRMLAERDLDLGRDAPPELLRERRRAGADYDRAQADLAALGEQVDPEARDALVQRLVKARSRQPDLEREIRKSSPRLASLLYPSPLGLSAAAGLLDPGDLLVSYLVDEEKTLLFSLLDGSLEVHRVTVSRERLERLTTRFRRLLVRPDEDPARARAQGQELYDLLVAPVAGRLHRARRLVVCPDGPLHLLPFAALQRADGSYLVEAKPVSMVTSATVLGELGKGAAREPDELALVAFGEPEAGEIGQGSQESSPTRSLLRSLRLPPLPGSRSEVEAIARHFSPAVKLYLGREAREEAAKKVDRRVRYLHFACHGVLDDTFPLNSGLVLSGAGAENAEGNNGLLQAWEVLEAMRIDAELVSLSACDSGLGTERGGEGLVGLARAFLYAGAHSILASLWEVSDESTAVLMDRFYGYLREGVPKSDALRLAMVSFIRRSTDLSPDGARAVADQPSSYSDPYHWAGFFLTGDWR